MIQLFRKDIELCQNVLIVGISAMLIPYVPYVAYAANATGMNHEQTIELWSLCLIGGAQISIMLSILSIAILSGYVVAGERRERSSEFMAYLPPSRSKVLASKAVLCLSWIAVIVAFHLGVVELLVPWISNGEFVLTERESWPMLAATALFMFGSAWLGSCVLESPTIAVLGGLSAPVGIYILLAIAQLQFGWFLTDESALSFIIYFLVGLGLVSFVAGWIYFVKRVEP